MQPEFGKSEVEMPLEDLTIDSNGDLEYKANSQLDKGDMQREGRGFNTRYTGTDTFAVQVTDSHGKSTTKYIEFNIVTDRHGKNADIVSQTETTNPPHNVNDEAQITPDEIVAQLDTDLADTNQQIAAAMREIHEARGSDVDVSEVQAKLDEFSQIKADLMAQKEALGVEKDVETETQEAETDKPQDETPLHIDALATDEDTMPSLDNIQEHLATVKATTAEVPHEALATAATLLGDTTEQTQSTKVIQAVEEHDTKEPVKNPDAPTHDSNAADADDGANAVADVAETAEYVPDVHNQIPDDTDQQGLLLRGVSLDFML